jgi:hypothetical protein
VLAIELYGAGSLPAGVCGPIGVSYGCQCCVDMTGSTTCLSPTVCSASMGKNVSCPGLFASGSSSSSVAPAVNCSMLTNCLYCTANISGMIPCQWCYPSNAPADGSCENFGSDCPADEVYLDILSGDQCPSAMQLLTPVPPTTVGSSLDTPLVVVLKRSSMMYANITPVAAGAAAGACLLIVIIIVIVVCVVRRSKSDSGRMTSARSFAETPLALSLPSASAVTTQHGDDSSMRSARLTVLHVVTACDSEMSFFVQNNPPPAPLLNDVRQRVLLLN